MKEKRNKEKLSQTQKVKSNSTALQAGRDIKIENLVIQNSDSLFKRIKSQIFGKSKAIPTEINEISTYINFDIPKLPPLISNRVELVKKIFPNLLNNGFLYIVGDKGTGKSIFSALICKRHSNLTYWFSFKNLSANPEEYIHKCFSSLFNSNEIYQNTEKYFDEKLISFNQNTLFIFDDLPNLQDHPNLSDILVKLITACKRFKLLIVISSNYKPTQNIKTLFKDYHWLVNIPLFSESEILELFIKNNAPKKYTNTKFVTFIASITKRHPILINSLIRFLNENDWKSNEDLLTTLIKGDFALSDKDEYFSIFSKTIKDPDLKELVYRLDIVQDNFDDSHIRLVSEIEPNINHPIEKLSKIKDIWIQEIKGEFCISPLIRNFGAINLPSSTVKQINIKLAHLIISKKIINPFEATNAIMYFLKAENYDEATKLLIFALISVIESEQNKIYDYALFSIWSDQKIPNNVSFDLKLALRSFQLRAFTKLEKDTSFIVNDLDNLLNKANSSNWLGLLTASFSLAVSKKCNKKVFYKSLIKASHLVDIDKLLQIKSKMSIEHSLFLMYGELDTQEDFIDWLTTIEKLPQQKRDVLFESDTAIDTCVSICESIFLIEFGKAEDKQNWEKTILVLDEFEKKALIMNIEILWVSAICAKIIIKAEHQNRYYEAILLGQSTIKKASNNPVIQYLLYDILAREFLFKADYKHSEKYFSRAINEKIGTVLIPHKIYSYLWFSQTLSNINKKRALLLNHKSVEFAEKHKEYIPKYLLSLCYGEYAIQLFENNNYNESLIYFSKTSEILHNEEVLLDFKKEKFVVIGNFIIYITTLLQTNAPPNKNENGSIILKPESGSFLKNNSQITSLYDENTEIFNTIVLTNLALETDNEELTIFWAKKAYKIAKTKNQYKHIYNIACNVLIPYLLINKKYEESSIIFHNCFSNLNKDFISKVYGDKQANAYKQNLLINLIIPTLLYNGILLLNHKITKKDFIKIFQILKNGVFEISHQHNEIFNVVNNILSKTLSEECKRENAVKLANYYTNNNESELAIFSMLATSLNQNNTPQTSLEIHLAINKQLQQYYSQSKYRFRKILIQFFNKYWEFTFEQKRFRFKSPDIVEKDLDKAFRSKEDIRITEIIKVITYGLSSV